MSSASSPIVLQGVPVTNPYKTDNTPYQSTTAGNSSYHEYTPIESTVNAVPLGGGGGGYMQQQQQPNNQRGENAPKQYQDVFWAVLFIVHFIAMIGLITMSLTSSSSYDNDNNAYNIDTTTVYSFVTTIVGLTGLISVTISFLSLAFMQTNAILLVKMALTFSVLCSLFIALLGFTVMNSIMVGCIGLFSFAVGLCYMKVVWVRIPFAASNLVTALSAIRANLGVTIISLFIMMIAFVWTIGWNLGMGNALASSNVPIIFLLFLSFYWVHQVLQNTLHVTVAGVVGTWWFVPEEANHFCSNALNDSFIRSISYSFGSICFGSFIVAIVQALRALEYHTRDNDDFQWLSCIIQCLLSCIQGILECINQWAYVYVGLYGFSYLEAGRNVMQLFENKGWTVIISDDLAGNVLFMMSAGIGLLCGFVGLVIGSTNNSAFESIGFDNAMFPAFFVGLLSGFLFSSIVMSVVGSGVNTVIVCYAEDPAAFQMNHPQLSTDMRQSWVQAWPDIIQ